MPMNENTERFRTEAIGIAKLLLNPDQFATHKFRDLQIRDGLYIDDVQDEAWQFWREVKMLNALGFPFPVIRSDGKRDVPVAIANNYIFRDFVDTWILKGWRHFGHEDNIYEYMLEQENLPSGVSLISIDQAVEVFREGVVEFLMTRIQSVVEFFGDSIPLPTRSWVPLPLLLSSKWFGGNRVKTVGFMVEVHTSTPDLRVHVSPSFRRNWRFFAAPTTPARGTLTGGIYEFGVDGGPYSTITPDVGTFNIPHATVSPTLNL